MDYGLMQESKEAIVSKLLSTPISYLHTRPQDCLLLATILVDVVGRPMC